MYPSLIQYIESLTPQVEGLSGERKKLLDNIAAYITAQKEAGQKAHLTFICTHNSRRSHLGQIWAATAAAYYGLHQIYTYSGGTEATAFNPRAVAALQRAGLGAEKGEGANPRWQITFSESAAGLECFSKTYDHPANPQKDFAAIMTCSEANENCPFIPGAALRVAIPYEDPKIADGTSREKEVYDERCKQIAAEMFYMIKQVMA